MGLTDLPLSSHVDQEFDRLVRVPPVDFEAYGGGLCRRRIRLSNVDPTLVVGELEDDFHHFRIELHHNRETIIEAVGIPLRGPWTSCMDVGDPLRAVEGHPMSARSTAIGAYTSPTSNCTHLFDLTGLAVAHAMRDVSTRQYDLLITDPVDGGVEMVLWRDGELELHWVFDGETIVEPEEWKGAPLLAKFIPWAEDTLDPDAAEGAIALRRMLHISMGRGMDLDALETGDGHADGPIGRCYSYTPEIAVTAIRLKGSVRDFADPDEASLLLADMGVRNARLDR